jgi:hypothetical protein
MLAPYPLFSFDRPKYMFLYKQPLFTLDCVLFISFILLMAAASSSDVSKSIFTNYVTSSLSTEKLNGSNDNSWAAYFKLWVHIVKY